jgi:hypothetical protein
MGIRFYCPNGHKLNVKDFLAGRKGICPTCGAKMQIPRHSIRRRSRHGEPKSAVEVQADSATGSKSASPPPGTVEPPPMPAIAATSVLASDPLSNASDAVWYVRPPSGGQFGPANSETMRVWLSEGRVGSDTLVWREGWRDWRAARSVFTQPSAPLAIPGLDAIYSEPVAFPPHRPKQRSAALKNRALVAGGLFLIVVVLLALFLVVVRMQ